MVKKWPTVDFTYLSAPSISPDGDGLRVGLLTLWQKDGQGDYRAIIFGSDGVPEFVWKPQEAFNQTTGAYCSLKTPLVRSTSAWLGSTGISGSARVSASYAFAPYSELEAVATALPLIAGNQGQDASDEVLGHFMLDGNSVSLFDRVTGETTILAPNATVSSYYDPRPVAASALMPCVLASGDQAECIWTRGSGSSTLLSVPGGTIMGARTDGTTVVWAQSTEPPDGNGLYSGDFYTSPFATSAAGIVPTMRRKAPALAAGARAFVNDGYHAVHDYNAQSVVVSRISDFHQWTFPVPADDASGEFNFVVYVDSQEVWFLMDGGLYRQRLDALGAGSPAP
jgi:hypothetical protein